MTDEIEISWGVSDDGDPASRVAPARKAHEVTVTSGPALETPGISTGQPEIEELKAHVAELEEEVLHWKHRADDWERQAILHERNLEEIEAAKLQEKKELESAREEIRRLKNEIGKPWWKRMTGK
jgi:hypothetical protein